MKGQHKGRYFFHDGTKYSLTGNQNLAMSHFHEVRAHLHQMKRTNVNNHSIVFGSKEFDDGTVAKFQLIHGIEQVMIFAPMPVDLPPPVETVQMVEEEEKVVPIMLLLDQDNLSKVLGYVVCESGTYEGPYTFFENKEPEITRERLDYGNWRTEYEEVEDATILGTYKDRELIYVLPSGISDYPGYESRYGYDYYYPPSYHTSKAVGGGGPVKSCAAQESYLYTTGPDCEFDGIFQDDWYIWKEFSGEIVWDDPSELVDEFYPVMFGEWAESVPKSTRTFSVPGLNIIHYASKEYNTSDYYNFMTCEDVVWWDNAFPEYGEDEVSSFTADDATLNSTKYRLTLSRNLEYHAGSIAGQIKHLPDSPANVLAVYTFTDSYLYSEYTNGSGFACEPGTGGQTTENWADIKGSIIANLDGTLHTLREPKTMQYTNAWPWVRDVLYFNDISKDSITATGVTGLISILDRYWEGGEDFHCYFYIGPNSGNKVVETRFPKPSLHTHTVPNIVNFPKDAENLFYGFTILGKIRPK